MRTYKLADMTNGWFVGGFSPSTFTTTACEVAVKTYSAGDFEESHFHKVATEITLVLSGKVKMFDQVWEAGDILVLDPGDTTGFLAITDAVNVVVKLPGALNDKYLA